MTTEIEQIHAEIEKEYKRKVLAAQSPKQFLTGDIDDARSLFRILPNNLPNPYVTLPHPEGGDDHQILFFFDYKKGSDQENCAVLMSRQDIKAAIEYAKEQDINPNVIDNLERGIEGIKYKEQEIERAERLQEVAIAGEVKTSAAVPVSILAGAFMLASAVLIGTNNIADSVDRNTRTLNDVARHIGYVNDRLRDTNSRLHNNGLTLDTELSAIQRALNEIEDELGLQNIHSDSATEALRRIGTILHGIDLGLEFDVGYELEKMKMLQEIRGKDSLYTPTPN